MKFAAILHNCLKIFDGHTERGKNPEVDFYTKRKSFADTRCYRNLRLTATSTAKNAKAQATQAAKAIATAEATIASTKDKTLVGSQFDPDAHPTLVIDKEVDPDFNRRRAHLEQHYKRQLDAGKAKRLVTQKDRTMRLEGVHT